MKRLLQLTTLALISFTINLSYSQEQDYWDQQVSEISNSCGISEWYNPIGSRDQWHGILNLCGKELSGICKIHIAVTGDSSFVDSVEMLIPAVYKYLDGFIEFDLYHNLEFQIEVESTNLEYVVVEFKKKWGIIYRYFNEEHFYVDAKDFFDEIYTDETYGTKVLVRNKKKWGLYDWYKRSFILECDYPTKESVLDNPPTGRKTVEFFC